MVRRAVRPVRNGAHRDGGGAIGAANAGNVRRGDQRGGAEGNSAL